MKYIKLFASTFFIIFILSFSSCTDILMGDEGKLDEEIHLSYQTITELELPFENEWYVVWGGRSAIQNQHFYSRNERYAIDVLQIVNGVSFTGDGTQNEDYYCFGKRLNAPGTGKIIAMENNIEDNIPGALNRDQPGGNYIIIDHLNGEVSVMAHFKKNSIIVSIGDTVEKGQEVGKAGNSGNSTEPHLHYHLQTTSESPSDGIGFPIQFTNYYENDVFIGRGEPVRGQKIRRN
ncbi:M23 family metallopeptidase [Aquimarina sp. 2201CG5-10]|uniref:M23 family metallopeptidase n=1 Tax=Aquimarina callyspongiae TaxID=3098150 RepID=UPI002AB349B5|nr:M23 family metallopeptidase [Aquimarina sp. 2201CG5-10]MDY8136056.1 M23 family metallopeptidase [Aquimarina sp. 2201CG5-10]